MTFNPSRRAALVVALSVAAGAFSAFSPVYAQEDYPNRAIRWIVGFPAGGGSDFLARTVGSALSEELGQPVVIENRPGAGAMIGAQTAARAAPDGYTVWSGDMATLVFNPKLYQEVPYKVSDFTPVGQMARFNMVITAALKAPFSTMQEAVEAIRKNPGKYSYASVGAGTNHHIVMELFKHSAGLDILHVPYKGMAPAVQAILGGQVDLAPIDSGTARVYVKDKMVVPLAVASDKRLPAFPGVPTMHELGYKDVEMYAWQGLFVPAGTPQPVVDRLAKGLEKALGYEKVRKALLEQGAEITYDGPEKFKTYINEQIAFWNKVIDDANVKIEN